MRNAHNKAEFSPVHKRDFDTRQTLSDEVFDY